MTDMMNRLKKSHKPRPPIAIIYGRSGIGKTSLANCAPNCINIQLEDGLVGEHLAKAHTFGVLQSYDEFVGALKAVAANHKSEKWQTVVIDSLDALDPLVKEHVCEENNWSRLEDGAYGAGKSAHVNAWAKVITMLQHIRNSCGLGVILVGHNKPVQVTSPDSDPYHQQSLTLHQDVAKPLIAHSDLVLFATFPTHTISKDLGFNKKATRAITEAAVLMTTEQGAHVAKNRFSMPDKIPMQWDELKQYVPAWK